MKRHHYNSVLIKSILVIIAFYSSCNISKAQLNPEYAKYSKNETEKLYNPQSYWGLDIGGSFIKNLDNIAIPVPAIRDLIQDKKFYSSDFFINFSYWRFLKEFQNEGSALSFDIGYRGLNDSIWRVIEAIPATINNHPKTLSVSYEQVNTVSYITFSPLYNYVYNINDWKEINQSGGSFSISLGAGFEAGYAVDNKSQARKLMEVPFTWIKDTMNTIRYENNGKTAILYDSKINSLNKFNFSLKAETNVILRMYNKNNINNNRSLMLYLLGLGYCYSFKNVTNDPYRKISRFYITFKMYIHCNDSN